MLELKLDTREKTLTGIVFTCTDSDTREAAETALDNKVLDYIREHPDESTNVISEALRKDRQKVTRACERLKHLGLVEMEVDGRAHRWIAAQPPKTNNNRTRKK